MFVVEDALVDGRTQQPPPVSSNDRTSEVIAQPLRSSVHTPSNDIFCTNMNGTSLITTANNHAVHDKTDKLILQVRYVGVARDHPTFSVNSYVSLVALSTFTHLLCFLDCFWGTLAQMV